MEIDKISATSTSTEDVSSQLDPSNIDTMSFSSLKRLLVSAMTKNTLFTSAMPMGMERKEIEEIIRHPEYHPVRVMRLMEYMYQNSGYIRRLIDYYANASIVRFYIDTEITSKNEILISEKKKFKSDYISYSSICSKFNFSNHIHYIVREMMLHDACFAFVSENEFDTNFFFLNPLYCRISGMLNGSVYTFQISKRILNAYKNETLPQDLFYLLTNPNNAQNTEWIDVPYEHAFCLKYFDNYTYIVPPLFHMISNVLLINDYKKLARSKAINDAYKLLVLPVPMKDGKITNSHKVLLPYVETVASVIQDNIGVVPYPGEIQSVEFSSTNADDRDKVSDARGWAYAEAGVPEAIMSGSASGSELKQSIINDSGDLYRIYRMIESWVDIQMKIKGYYHADYHFVYKILNMTTFNAEDVAKQELSFAQASIPNKQRVCAALGMNPNAVIGNTMIENHVLGDIFAMFSPLQSSFTQSNDSTLESGRPKINDIDLSKKGEEARTNDTNNPDNRA